MNIRCGRIVVMAMLASLGLSGAAQARPPWWTKSRMSKEEFEDWLNIEMKGFRLTYLNGYDAGGSPLYAAMIVKDGKDSRYHVNGSPEFLRKKDAEYRPQGFRPICVTGYLNGRTPEFGVVWVKDGRPAGEKIDFHLTEKEYTQRVKVEREQHFMPRVLTGYADETGVQRFTVLFAPATRLWDEAHDLTAEQYQKAIDDWKAKGFRPSSITSYLPRAGLRFAAVFVKDGVDWCARHDLTSEGYQGVVDQLTEKENGWRPASISVYAEGNRGGLELFDEAMRRFMSERGISTGALAVSRNGKLLWEHGYGLDATTPLRLASLTKAFTAAAIRRLIGEGKLTLNTEAFPLLRLRPPPKQQQDRRLNDITIRQLLDHKGGWDRDQTFDPMFRPLEIAAALKAPAPPGPVDIIRYMMGQPLQFAPGSKYSYSNFGYCVLGRVIEKISGQSYVAYVRTNICEPLGVKSVELARTLLKYRNPREPVYRSSRKGRNVLDPESKDEVPLPDGTFYLEAMDAHGGLIGSARDVVRFLDTYWLSGEPRKGGSRAYTHFGSLAGTFTMAMQQRNGINVAVLFNQSANQSRDSTALQVTMENAAERQSSASLRYATLWVWVE